MFRIVSTDSNGQRFFLRKFNDKLLWNKEGKKSWRKWKKRNKANSILEQIKEKYNTDEFVKGAFVEEFEFEKKAILSEEQNEDSSQEAEEETNPGDYWDDYHEMCKRCTRECKQSWKVSFVGTCPRFTTLEKESAA